MLSLSTSRLSTCVGVGVAALLALSAATAQAAYSTSVLGYGHRPDTTGVGTPVNGITEPNNMSPGTTNNGLYYSMSVSPNVNDVYSGSPGSYGYYNIPLHTVVAGTVMNIEFYVRSYSEDEDGETISAGGTAAMEAMLWLGDNYADDTFVSQWFIRWRDAGGAVISEATKTINPTSSINFPSDGPLSALAPTGTASYDYGWRVSATIGADGGVQFRTANFITDITPAVPEPASVMLCLTGAAALLLRKRR